MNFSTVEIANIWARVSRRGADECWPWIGFIDDKGYGSYKIRGTQNKGHRLVWELLVGPIPKGLFLCHTCRTRHCVNPAHLYAGDAYDNMRDKWRDGTDNAGERHPCSRLTAEQVREVHNSQLPDKELAKLYKISRRHVCDIKHEMCWRHLWTT